MDQRSIGELYHGIRLNHGSNTASVEKSGIIDPTLRSIHMTGLMRVNNHR